MMYLLCNGIFNVTELTNQVDYQVLISIDLETTEKFPSDNINNIIISSPIRNEEDIRFKKAYLMFENGIDIFNESDPFFNDICFKYKEYDKNVDVSIKHRREEYFAQISFCDINRVLIKIDYDNKMNIVIVHFIILN